MRRESIVQFIWDNGCIIALVMCANRISYNIMTELQKKSWRFELRCRTYKYNYRYKYEYITK